MIVRYAMYYDFANSAKCHTAWSSELDKGVKSIIISPTSQDDEEYVPVSAKDIIASTRFIIMPYPLLGGDTNTSGTAQGRLAGDFAISVQWVGPSGKIIEPVKETYYCQKIGSRISGLSETTPGIIEEFSKTSVNSYDHPIIYYPGQTIRATFKVNAEKTTCTNFKARGVFLVLPVIP